MPVRHKKPWPQPSHICYALAVVEWRYLTYNEIAGWGGDIGWDRGGAEGMFHRRLVLLYSAVSVVCSS